ncbi:MAG: hypothetical protein GYA33_13260 [Thermogutta sp.]|nr:hypothetical protein [Thermogutta sp.]
MSPWRIRASEEPTMGLLEKWNPKATWRSVLRAAVFNMGVGAAFFFLFFKPEWREAWPITLPPWLLLSALVGGLIEWQVPPDDYDPPPPRGPSDPSATDPPA